MSNLSKRVNIGKVLEVQLFQVGIDTFEQLKELGSKEAWLKIKEIDNSACYNRLCALEGAIEDVRWHHLKEDTKKDLLQFYNEHE